MKKIILIGAVVALLFTGCNTTAPSERVDRDGNVTINMNFKQVKKAYVKAFYEGKLGRQHIYYQWLKDNRERVNPFLDLEEWREKIEKQYKKDKKTIETIKENINTMPCFTLINSIQKLYSIWSRSNSEEVANLRFKIANRMNETKCKSIHWNQAEVPLYPKNSIEWLADLD